jgi:hypothetical protein
MVAIDMATEKYCDRRAGRRMDRRHLFPGGDSAAAIPGDQAP